MEDQSSIYWDTYTKVDLTSEEKTLIKSKDIKLKQDVFNSHKLMMNCDFLEEDLWKIQIRDHEYDYLNELLMCQNKKTQQE